jgi:hypothetical protein
MISFNFVLIVSGVVFTLLGAINTSKLNTNQVTETSKTLQNSVMRTTKAGTLLA